MTRQSSLAARVSLASLASAAFAAALAAIVACSFADMLLAREADRGLSAAATELARDLALPSSRPVEDVIREEEDEGTSLGARFAVVGGAGERVGGDHHLGRTALGCTTFDDLRTCTVAGKNGARITAGMRSESRLGLFAFAALAAATLAAFVAWGLGGALARRALAPLVRLQGRIAALRLDGAPEATRTAALGDAEGVREVDELREAVHVLQARMHEALAHASRFASNAAHELRTPLTTLRAELELIAEGANEAAPASPPDGDASTRPEGAVGVGRALAKVRQLQDLTERLLVLASPEIREGARELVSLREIVEEIVLDLAPADAARVAVEARDDGAVRGDAAAIGIVVSNGLSNALKFGDRVAVEIGKTGKDAIVAIEDDGPGVSDEDRDKVFEPFERGSRAPRAEGHGIGLALVAHIAKRHGGSATLLASRRFRSGTRLEVRFPIAR